MRLCSLVSHRGSALLLFRSLQKTVAEEKCFFSREELGGVVGFAAHMTLEAIASREIHVCRIYWGRCVENAGRCAVK